MADGIPVLWAGMAAVAAGMGVFIAYQLASRRAPAAVRRVLDLAGQVMEVADSIHGDLPRSLDDAEALRLRTDCEYLGRRAEHVLRQGKVLRLLPDDRLQTALERLHDDHRRMVELRLQVDAEMSRRRRMRREQAAAPELAGTGS